MSYEPFRGWRGWDGVVFLKSASAEHVRLLEALHARDVPVIFDANVNYYEVYGPEHYTGMLPTPEQTGVATEITRRASAVIADSEFLEGLCRRHNARVCWIPDSVRMDLVPAYAPWVSNGKPLRLLWSGEAVKLFELLAVEPVLRRFRSWIELVLVTNDLTALSRWRAGYRERFEDLLGVVPHRIVAFRSIPALLQVYAAGGLVISPRFLDNSYNLGHTEWKITLGMACGRLAVCSAVPSYERVAERSGGRGIRICRTPEEWESVLDALLAGKLELGDEEAAARAVVERHYATDVVARAHVSFVRDVVEGRHGDRVSA
jgi:hypothetical protein